jgi:hypothetical protein
MHACTNTRMTTHTMLASMLFVLCSTAVGCGGGSGSTPSGESGDCGGGSGGGDVYCFTPGHDAGSGGISTTQTCVIIHHVSPGVNEMPACSVFGGMITATPCPAPGLNGCCTSMDGRIEECFYDNTDAGVETAQIACSASKGAWATTM